MKISQSILEKLNEKASIDWNNYLSKEEVNKFLSNEDKEKSAKEIIYSDDFEKRYNDLHNDLQAKYNNSWEKDELVQDLVNFYNYNHLNEDNSLDLWKSQMNQKNEEELKTYLDKLYKQLYLYNETNKEIKSNKFELILQKINYIENKLGIKSNKGRILH